MNTKSRFFIEPLESRIAPALAGTLSLGALGGANGFRVPGAADMDAAGVSLSNAGDFDGDGYEDYIIGARNAEGGLGAAYLIFGQSEVGSNSRPVSNLGGFAGFELIGEDANSQTGFSVAAAGDVNGDGYDDLIIGAPKSAQGGTERGAAYVVFGHAGPFSATFSLADLNGANGFRITGSANNNHLGTSVSGAGDVNGDGFDDVVIGAPDATGAAAGSGVAVVVFGKNAAFDASQTLTQVGLTEGIRFNGAVAGDHVGAAVAFVGDLNGDGFGDLAIGAPDAAGGGTSRGSVYVVFGQKTLGNIEPLATLAATKGFRLDGVTNGDHLGKSLGGAGDLNGDGFSDLAIGAPDATVFGTATGITYVLFGQTGTGLSGVDLSGLNGSNGLLLIGGAAGDQAGASVKSAGDVNADGFDDLLIGAPTAAGGGTTRGEAYLIYGQGTFGNSLALAGLDGTAGFKMTGVGDFNLAGTAVSGAGDVNGDGYDDIFVGAPIAAAGGTMRGSGYIVLGGLSGAEVVPTLSANGKTATFTELDGDLITVKITKGSLVNANFDLFQPTGAGGVRFSLLDLDTGSAGSNLTITAKPTAAGGDGLVNLGFLDANGIDLGKVKIAGNVELLMMGDGDATTLAVKSFNAQTLGRGSFKAQDSGGPNIAKFTDPIGTLSIKGDADRARLDLVSAKQILIGGSLLGGARQGEGRIDATSGIGTIKIGRDVRASGGVGTGTINVGGAIGNLTIGGSALGSNGLGSGFINVGGNIANMKIGRDLRDVSIISGGDIKVATIGGSLIDTDTPGGGRLEANGSLGKLTIGGDILGLADAPTVISGVGTLAAVPSSFGVKTVTVKGSVENAAILAGVFQGAGLNGHAKVGVVTVKGDFTASSIAAGVDSQALATARFFGNDDDAILGGGQASSIASIDKIVVKGQIRGTVGGGDHFGFVAQRIGACIVGGQNFKLNAGPSNDIVSLGSNNDFRLLELP